jgi:hypothetical protein
LLQTYHSCARVGVIFLLKKKSFPKPLHWKKEEEEET